jgi:hypothetical protein
MIIQVSRATDIISGIIFAHLVGVILATIQTRNSSGGGKCTNSMCIHGHLPQNFDFASPT